MIARIVICLLGAGLLCGCAVDVRDFNRAPEMNPIGTGLVPKRVAMVSEPVPLPQYRGNNSIWQDSRADLFSDTRARKIGDTVTVRILIADKAKIKNDSERKRDATNSLDLGFAYGTTSSDVTIANAGTLGGSADSKTHTKSEGDIERKEDIRVTRLPMPSPQPVVVGVFSASPSARHVGWAKVSGWPRGRPILSSTTLP